MSSGSPLGVAKQPPPRRSVRNVSTCVSAGVTGKLHLDENGDREMDFALWDMTDSNTSTFQVHAHVHTHTPYTEMTFVVRM